MGTYSTCTDQELVGLLKQGNRYAYTEIFERYSKVMYSHVYNKLRDDEGARDIVQDIFVILWEKRLVIENINLLGYLFTMVRNKVLNLVSHHKVVSDYETSIRNYMQPEGKMADELIREKQLAAIITAEIEALPPRMREIFELSRYEHLSNKEIATKLNLSEHTVADQIKKSLKTLRLKIGLSIIMALLMNQS
ncbi:RNA polymerase sigma-70 factor [Pedobacter hiemivivus]|uniref:RNA polymerase sigma-70 factor n=1 Tax=Pedobacter hiemivivus TaxID=2530454 RepID=A0A4R0N8T6_9SPHI|nr:RNA polymerase sigma-70 factor [Pedobacter hiemivivus]TCC96578.1 RNA polymerase sigma-70 factor [Pedobacter hiemivivus]